MDITIPHKFKPRKYQLKLLKAIDSGKDRAVIVRHRRTGKDKTCFNIIVKKAFERVGTYFHIFPTYAQGKKVIWDGIDKDGFKTLNHIPKQLIKSENGQEMKLELINGSIIQIVGTDGRNIDRIVGTNPIGVVFSEYSLQNPQARDLVRPILAENGGRAIFNYTPRGHNHGYDLFEMAKDNKSWFCEKLTANNTTKSDGTPVITEAIIQGEREAGMPEEMIQQEFFCSFEASIVGAYYSEAFVRIEKENRICKVPYEENLPVDTYWDLGFNDCTSIRFVQKVGKEIRLIDFYENNGKDLGHYLMICNDKQYKYGKHRFPHDGNNKSLQTGESPIMLARKLTTTPCDIVPAPKKKIYAIEAVRRMLAYCWFDGEKCKHGIRCLKEYHKEYDEKRKTFKDSPDHDRASHASDAFSYLAMNFEKISTVKTESVVTVDYSNML